MRDLPSLTSDITARADRLVTRARENRAAAQGRVANGNAPRNSISPAVLDGDTATLRLYDYIDSEGGYWGISADEVAQALDAIDGPVSRINLRVNSGGGMVWDGLAILNTLRAYDAPVTAIVDGVAASAASFIAVACDEVVMMPNSRMMIHDALGLCIGQAADMREYASFLDDTSDNIAEIYATKAGGSVEQWRTTMSSNGLQGQWYSPAQAVEAGLADRVEQATASDPAEDSAPQQPAATLAHYRSRAAAVRARNELKRARA